MRLTPANTLVLAVNGAVQLEGGEFGAATASKATVKFNNTINDFTGANAETITIDSVSALLDVALDARSISIEGLDATLSDFAVFGGNFGFELIAGGNIEAVATEAYVHVVAGAYEAGVTGGTLALRLTPANTIALSVAGGAHFVGGEFGSITATLATAKLNTTGVDYAGANAEDITIDGITATLDVGIDVRSISVVGLDGVINGFATFGGNFAFEQVVGGNVEVVATEAYAHVIAGDYEAGVTNGTLAMRLTPATTVALTVSGSVYFVGGEFGSISATLATGKFNTTGVDYSDANAEVLTIDTVSATLDVGIDVRSISIVGLDGVINGFATFGGNFAFEQVVGGNIEVVASEAYVRVIAGDYEAGVTDGRLAMRLTPDTTIALTVSGAV